ncbi:MAG: hypothetical protein KF836_07240 [Fimbriimonadaceae bacterium]|nr:hypothetical protein [Fimbriimonadaceae bacterium]
MSYNSYTPLRFLIAAIFLFHVASAQEIELLATHGGVVFSGKNSPLRKTPDLVKSQINPGKVSITEFEEKDLLPNIGTPLPVVNIKKDDLVAALYKAVPNGTTKEEFDLDIKKLFEEKDFVKHFDIKLTTHDPVALERFKVRFYKYVRFTGEKKENIQLIMGGLSHNAEFTVQFLPQASLPRGTQAPQSKPLRWQNRGSVSTTTNLKSSDVTLVDGDTKKGFQLEISGNYQGIGNPLQGLFYKESS